MSIDYRSIRFLAFVVRFFLYTLMFALLYLIFFFFVHFFFSWTISARLKLKNLCTIDSHGVADFIHLAPPVLMLSGKSQRWGSPLELEQEGNTKMATIHLSRLETLTICHTLLEPSSGLRESPLFSTSCLHRSGKQEKQAMCVKK